MLKTLFRYFIGSIGVATTLCLWEFLSRAKLVNPMLLPPPTEILPVLWKLITAGTVVGPLAHTLALLAIGYSIACACGITLGIAMGRSRAIHGLFEPVVELMRPIPKPALIPPLFLFLGIGAGTMIVIVTLVAFFPILISTIQGVVGIDRTLLDTARTFRWSKYRVLLCVVLPAALPAILAGMRVSLGLALALVILAEMLAADTGVGYLIFDMQRSFQLREMYAWVVLLAIVGLSLNSIFEWVEEHVIVWRGQ